MYNSSSIIVSSIRACFKFQAVQGTFKKLQVTTYYLRLNSFGPVSVTCPLTSPVGYVATPFFLSVLELLLRSSFLPRGCYERVAGYKGRTPAVFSHFSLLHPQKFKPNTIPKGNHVYKDTVHLHASRDKRRHRPHLSELKVSRTVLGRHKK